MVALACTMALGLHSYGCSERRPFMDDSRLERCGADGGVEFVEEAVTSIPAAPHTEQSLTYDSKPPTGGPHSSCWGNWGVHSEPLRPERFVHNLEHGGIALLYNCPDGCPDERRWLEQFARDNELTIVTEYQNLDTRFGLSAWSARAYSDCLDPAFVRDFYSRRVDRAPEQFSRPPPGPPSACR